MKINIYKQIVSFCLLSSVFLLLSSAPAEAQQVNLSFDPPIVQTKIKPGKSIVIGYTAVNLGDPTNLQFVIRPFTPLGQLGGLAVTPQMEGPVQFSLENTDIQLEKPFFFASKEKKQAVVRIRIPVGIPDGDYYYLVMAETVPAFSAAGQSTGIASATLGSPLLISITESGITEIKATVEEFSFKPDYTLTIGNNIVRIVDNARELPIVCSVRNMGKSLIQPQGTITDQNGGLKNKYTIVPQNILSNSQRIIKVFGDENTSSANSTLNLQHLTIGSHRVALEINFGENTPIQYKTLTFLALPIRLIKVMSVLLILVVLVFVIRFVKRRKG
jgi:hypothetical protein